MDDVEFFGGDAVAELLPDEVFEVGIGEGHHAAEDCPAGVGFCAEDAGQAVGAAGDGFGVDDGEVFSLDQAGPFDGVAVTDLGDEVDVVDLGQSAGVGPADQGDADPFGVTSFCDQ